MKKLFISSREAALNELLHKMVEDKDAAAHSLALNESATEICNDNIVLSATFDGVNWSVDETFDRTQLTVGYTKNICEPVVYIVLESPHVEEFKSSPPIPAAGKTGINVLQSLSLVMNNHCPKSVAQGTYKVAFVNAIQMQTSLGVKPTYFRDYVFRAMWHSGAKEAFATRLGGYLKDGDIVINGCTCGKTTSKQLKLREEVQVAIDELIKPLSVKFTEIRTEHPSVWGRIFNTANKYQTFADYSWKADSKLFKAYEAQAKP